MNVSILIHTKPLLFNETIENNQALTIVKAPKFYPFIRELKAFYKGY